MATMTFTAMFTVKPLQKEEHCWPVLHVAPGGDSAYERGGDACWKMGIKPLKETDLGRAQAFFDP